MRTAKPNHSSRSAVRATRPFCRRAAEAWATSVTGAAGSRSAFFDTGSAALDLQERCEDGEAVRLNRDVGAQAFTHGSDVCFGRGQYAPTMQRGRHLLAHALTHVVRQGGARSAPSVQRNDETIEERAEREAEEGHPQLREALVRSTREPLEFEFERELEGATRLPVRDDGGLRVLVDSSFTGTPRSDTSFVLGEDEGEDQ